VCKWGEKIGAEVVLELCFGVVSHTSKIQSEGIQGAWGNEIVAAPTMIEERKVDLDQ
jgi:hypothetical protein